jgi:hypothetical protein
LPILEHWTQTAELDIAAERIDQAFAVLYEGADPFSASAYPREFCRVARMLFRAIPWTSEFKRFREFDSVFVTYVEMLSYLGEWDEVDGLFRDYERTMPDKNARYIRYCGLQSLSKWLSLGGHLKTGHRRTLQNRPTEQKQNKSIYTS